MMRKAEAMTALRRPRLTQTDWLLAGLDTLCDAGPGALGAEPLARRIGTTKGSFYWHFIDVPAYHQALLDLWAAEIQAALDTATAATTDTARLRETAQAIAAPARNDTAALRAESAIRGWAGDDPAAARTLQRVDEMRLARLHALLSACGISNPEMARILYASAIGMQALRDRDTDQNAAAIGSLVDLVLALR